MVAFVRAGEEEGEWVFARGRGGGGEVGLSIISCNVI